LAQSVSKAFLRAELLKEDSTYWHLSTREVYNSRPDLFSPFQFTNFSTNFRNLKKSIRGEIDAILFDDEAVKKESLAFPRAEVNKRGNKPFHCHPAKQHLIDDVKNGAGVMYFNRPRDLRRMKACYMEFNEKVLRKEFNRQKQREKEQVGWQHRRNTRGARINLERLSGRNSEA
jgi:hypothetical protein